MSFIWIVNFELDFMFVNKKSKVYAAVFPDFQILNTYLKNRRLINGYDRIYCSAPNLTLYLLVIKLIAINTTGIQKNEKNDALFSHRFRFLIRIRISIFNPQENKSFWAGERLSVVAIRVSHWAIVIFPLINMFDYIFYTTMKFQCYNKLKLG